MAKKENKKIRDLVIQKLGRERDKYKKKKEWNRENEIAYRKMVKSVGEIDFETEIDHGTYGTYLVRNLYQLAPRFSELTEDERRGLRRKSRVQEIKWLFLNLYPKVWMNIIKSSETVSAETVFDEIECRQCNKIFTVGQSLKECPFCHSSDTVPVRKAETVFDDEIECRQCNKIFTVGQSLKECPFCHSSDTVPSRKIVVRGIGPETMREDIERAIAVQWDKFWEWEIRKSGKKYRLAHNWKRDYEWYQLHKKGMSIHQIAERELKNKQSRIKWENHIKRKERISPEQELDKAEGSKWYLFTKLRSAGGRTPLEHLIENAVSRVKKEILKEEEAKKEDLKIKLKELII